MSNDNKALITRILTAEKVVAVYAPNLPPISQEINEIWYCAAIIKKSIFLVQRDTYAPLSNGCRNELITSGAMIIISDRPTEKLSLKMTVQNCSILSCIINII